MITTQDMLDHKKKFVFLHIDFRSEDADVGYFCTPKNAKIIGSTHCDGLHFCVIPKFGDLVFKVVPDGMSEKYVFPVAKNVTEFLSIVAALRTTVYFDRMQGMSKADFEHFLAEALEGELNDSERLAEVEEFCRTFGVKPYEGSVYDAVMSLYRSFPYDEIEYTAEYYDVLGLEYPSQTP